MNNLFVLLQTNAVGEAANTGIGGLTKFISTVTTTVGEWAPKLLGAIVGLIVGLWIINKLMKVVNKGFEKANTDESLRPFLVTIISFALKVLLFITVAGMAGIEMTAFAAIIAGVGLAIGGAFNGSLGHLAAGVMILVFKPFKVGDLIELPDGTLGFVKEISVFVTFLETFQNKTEIVPNGAVMSGKITNLSMKGNLRIDMPFGIRYGADIDKAKSIVMNVLASDSKVLKDPAPRVAVNNLGENGVELLALPYSDIEGYWDVYWDTRQKIVEELGKAGYEAPLPQRIVTMTNAS